MVKALAAAVRDACGPRAWRLGERFVEEGQVERVADRGAQEQEFRVWAPGRPVAPTVSLYPEDEEWDCDCPSRADCCEHAAAAAAFLLQGPKAVEAASRGPTLRYELKKRREGLTLQRSWIDESGSATPVEESLSARRAGAQGGFSPREPDVKIDQLLIVTEGRVLPTETLPSLFGWLSRCEQVTLDGEAVVVAEQPPPPRAQLSGRDGVYELKIDAPAGVDQVVVDGVVRIGDSLHALSHTPLIGARLEKVPFVRRFEGEEVLEMMSELLPKLRKGMEVELGDTQLPRLVPGVEVRSELSVELRGDGLVLRGQLVYGDPPLATVEYGRLVPTGDRWPQRDAAAEKKVAHKLRARFELEPGETRFVRGAEAEALAERLRGFKGKVRGRAKLDRFGQSLRPRLHFSGADADAGGLGGLADARVELDFEGGKSRVDAGAVLEAWQRGDEGVALPEGGWARLPREFLEAHGERLIDLVAGRSGRPALAAHDLGAIAPICEALEIPLPPVFESLRPLVEGFEGIPNAQLPDDLQAELRDYQRRGVDWLAFARKAGLGAMLCDDMGLGKTLQALCAIEGPALVVCPTSLLHNWAQEAARFRPGLEVTIFHGPSRELPEMNANTLVLTSYGVLRLDTEKLAAQRFETLVLDEAQAIKNPDAQVARAAFELDASFKMTLSGTPVENRLDELWSQAHFTNPGVLGGLDDFKSRFARAISLGDAGAADRLRTRVRPFLLRRLKSEVAPELPPRTEVTVSCILDERERAVYDALRDQARSEVESLLDAGKGVMSVLEALLRLRQAACHRALVPGQEASDSAKLRRLRAELDESVAAGHRALVFSQWTSLLDLVEPGLRDIGVDFQRLDGSTRDRQGVVDAFQDPKGPPVMLLSLMAGGTGLNLTAADHVYFLDPWWNPAVEAQAADRAHRIGQDKPVVVHRLVARDTVDERILALQARKRGLADAVIEVGAGLSRDDLLALIG